MHYVAPEAMTTVLKVVRVDTAENGTVLVLEGQVLGPWVGALRSSCEEALAGSPAAVLVDLAGVTFVGAEGADLLRGLPAERVHLVNASPLVHAQLHSGGRS